MIIFEENKNYNLSDLTKSIEINYKEIFYKIENSNSQDNITFSLIKRLYFYIENSNRNKILDLIYDNPNEVNKFVFYWFLCDYLFYKRKLNFSSNNFLKYFNIADQKALVSVLLLLKNLQVI